MDAKLCHISGGRYSFLVRSPDMVQQGSLVFVLGDMPGRKVDTTFPSLYPEFNNKCQADLSMAVTKPVKLGYMSPVVVVKLEHEMMAKKRVEEYKEQKEFEKKVFY